MSKKVQEMTTFLVSRKGGNDQRVTVPSSWKVTFGPLTPGSKSAAGYGNAPTLRFYESENKQRMVITDVTSFRDTSILIEEKRTSIKQQTLRKDVPGGSKDVIVEGRVEEWVNPDRPQQVDQEFFRLENKKEDFEDDEDDFGT